MKILMLSDIHIHRHKNNEYILEYGFNLLNRLIRFCEKEEIPEIHILGDVFEKAEPRLQYMSRFKEIIENTDIKFKIILGNHDIYSEGESYLNLLNGKVDIYNKPTIQNYGNTTLIFIPYSLDIEKQQEIIRECYNKATGDKKVLLGHFDINSFIMSSSGSIKQENGITLKRLEKFDLVISGHYHKWQKKQNIIYLGCPYKYKFSDIGDKKSWIIFDTETLEYERKINHYDIEFYDIYMSDLRKLKEIKIKNSFFRIIIDRFSEKTLDLKKVLYKKGAQFVEISERLGEKRKEDDIIDISKDDLNLYSIVKEMIKKEYPDDNQILQTFENIS